MIGERFGCWVVLAEDGKKYNRVAYLCECDCGTRQTVNGNQLKRGKTTGCLKCAGIRKNNYNGKHFYEYSEYWILSSMNSRCGNKNDKRYNDYGGRGITVCERWKGKGGFINFMDDMGIRGNKSMSIDRINNNEGYCPENCRWVDAQTQCNNRRLKKSRYITFHKLHNTYMVQVRGKFVGYQEQYKDAVEMRNQYIKDNNIKGLRLIDDVTNACSV